MGELFDDIEVGFDEPTSLTRPTSEIPEGSGGQVCSQKGKKTEDEDDWEI
jgi:hypothetical protein